MHIHHTTHNPSRNGTTFYLVDDKVHVARRDHLSVEQVPFVADATDGPAGGLDGHHLLDHLLFVGVEEARELGGVERGVQLEEAAQRRHGRLRTHIRQEKREVALRGLGLRIFRVCRQLLLVIVRRWVGRDEFWARVEEELLEGGEALITVSGTKIGI